MRYEGRALSLENPDKDENKQERVPQPKHRKQIELCFLFIPLRFRELGNEMPLVERNNELGRILLFTIMFGLRGTEMRN